MSSASKDIDLVAEVLKKLKGKDKDKVKPIEVEKAIEQYNTMKAGMKNKTEEEGLKTAEKLRAANRELREKIINLENQLKELTNRLSKIAGSEHPEITDLSDPFRPTKLAEQFRELYDDEWTHAYEELNVKMKDENKIIDVLKDLIKEIEKFCVIANEEELKKMKIYLVDDLVSPKIELKDGKGTRTAMKRSEMNKLQEESFFKMVRELRRTFGDLAVTPLAEIFVSNFDILQKWDIKGQIAGLNEYIMKTLRLIWMMKLQSPPMELEWAEEGKSVDKSKFTFFTRTGEKTEYTVWPAVLLHKNGPLVSKGVVQAAGKGV